MHQVTAIFQDSEIGYGEAEGLQYAIEECLESIPRIFDYGAAPEEIDLLFIYPNGKKCKTNLQDHLDLAYTLKFVG
jgi:hypothetical protein